MLYRCLPRSKSRSNSLRRRGSDLDSFSLVEMVIAIGVASFILVSILGLMAYATQTVQVSDNYTRLAFVESQILTQLSTEPITAGPLANYTSTAHGTTTVSYTNFYTFDGLPTNSAANAVGGYQAIIRDATPTSPVFKEAGVIQYMETIQVTIRSPCPLYSHTNYLVTGLVNYGQ